MNLEQELKQTNFSDQFLKAVLNILVTADKIGAETNAILKPHGISKEQFNVLRILRGQYPNPSTIQNITERMISKSSNATRLVEKMRLKGLVERAQCESDRRRVDVVITEQGLELLQTVDPLVKKSSEKMRKISEDEAATLNNLLEKMRE